MEKAKPLLVGAHISAAGGVHKALYRGQKLGATTIQIFTSNQKQWKGKKIDDKEVLLWKKGLKETHITKVMSHNSYLINLGSPKKDLLNKSRKAFLEELLRCQLLEIDFLNFHPGSATGSEEIKCLDTIIESLLGLASNIKKGKTRLLLETTAGQGTNVGYCFDHLAYIIKRVEKKIPIGVCIDTCHIFAAGYDIRTKDTWDKTLKEFNKIVGMKYLYAFHVNDSVYPLGSKKDRHANLGKGKIGLDSFHYLMSHPKIKYIPKYLETPYGDKFWKNEIQMLLNFATKK